MHTSLEQQSRGLTPLIVIFFIGTVVCFALTVLFTMRAQNQIEEKLRASRESISLILEEHRKMSALMVESLSNPLAKVTVRLVSEGVRMSGVEASVPQMVKGGTA